ncbi:hypothetical protein QYF36_024464 [Acer negundo]|nr:hypothetical protein QYF36_024464 [Acer negundo]
MMKDKPPDTISTAKRARAQEDAEKSYLRNAAGVSFKSKLLGSTNPSNRNERNNIGTINFGRKSGGVGNSGGVNYGSKVNNRPHVKVERAAIIQKETGSRVMDNNGKKGGRSNNPVNHGNKKVGGSRFEILREEMDENIGAKKEQSRTPYP